MTRYFMMVSDIVEANGKTIRENNMAVSHEIPLGALVEVTRYDDHDDYGGIRLFVVGHVRDCDGTPLYMLGPHRQDREQPADDILTRINQHRLGAFSKHSLTVIELPKDAPHA